MKEKLREGNKEGKRGERNRKKRLNRGKKAKARKKRETKTGKKGLLADLKLYSMCCVRPGVACGQVLRAWWCSSPFKFLSTMKLQL